MKIFPIHSDIQKYLKERNLQKKFEKQKELFENNLFHPSLETELLEPKKMRIWSFRLDKKYRALFFFKSRDAVEIIDVNNHYDKNV